MTTRVLSAALALSVAAGVCSLASAGIGNCGDLTAGDCCQGNGSPGCDDLKCCNTVCVIDPFCCQVEWDATCAKIAQGACGNLCTPGLQILSMRFEQITYDTTNTGFVPFTEYGRIVIVYIPDPVILQWFLQVEADVGLGQGWLVRNVPLLGVDILGDDQPQEVAIQVDLGAIGIERFMDMTGALIQHGIELTPNPVASSNMLILPLTEIITPAVADFQGTSDDSDTGLVSLPAASKHPDRAPPKGDAKEWAWRHNLDNRDVGLNQCTPASMAISIHWLAKQYPESINLGGQTWYQTNAKLKEDLKFDCKNGTFLRDIVPGKMRFFQRDDKIIAPGWRIKYQADNVPLTFPNGYDVGNMIACRKGGNNAPTFDWLLQELQNGEDVEIHVGWYDQNGDRDGGHSMAVRGALRHGNKQYIWVTHDWDQEGEFHDAQGNVVQTLQERCDRPKPDDDTPAQDGGLETRLCQVVLDADGFMTLTCFRSLNKVELVTSESPPDPNDLLTCCPWDCGGEKDGVVGINDFLAVLAQWGQAGTKCHFAGNDAIGIDEFLKILAHWGDCP